MANRLCRILSLHCIKGTSFVVRIHTAQPEPMGGSRTGSLTLESMGGRGAVMFETLYLF